MQNKLKYELQQYFIRTDEQIGQRDFIKTVRCYLRRGKSTSPTTQATKFTKIQETKILIDFIEENNCWYNNLNEDNYLAEGAEQKVYFVETENVVIKVNTGIFYEFWEDYFDSLLLHNFFFPTTKYTFLGFLMRENNLCAVVKQDFVKSNQDTNLEQVKQLLIANGFKNKKNNDYFHKDLGIILEDLHDENVLSYDDILFFVDTVFYLTEDFYS